MSSASTLTPPRKRIGPVAWVGRSVIESMGYVGGVSILLLGAAGSLFLTGRSRRDEDAPGFVKSLFQQLFWMLYMGIPLVGLVHIAIGSFLSLQAYYGSTFVDGTGAVVGVGLLRNLGGHDERHDLRRHPGGANDPGAANPVAAAASLEDEASATADCGRIGPGGRAISRTRARVPRSIVSLAAWLPADRRGGGSPASCSRSGESRSALVGWQASQSMMGLSTEIFFMMMIKMMWFRDVVGLVVKGFFSALCRRRFAATRGSFRGWRRSSHPAIRSVGIAAGASGSAATLVEAGVPGRLPVVVAILVMNSSWFMLVYHAVPFYGPTLLPQP